MSDSKDLLHSTIDINTKWMDAYLIFNMKMYEIFKSRHPKTKLGLNEFCKIIYNSSSGYITKYPE
jgi:hypothetical protein